MKTCLLVALAGCVLAAVAGRWPMAAACLFVSHLFLLSLIADTMKSDDHTEPPHA